MKKECECTDECLGYLTKECKRIEEPKIETLEEASKRAVKSGLFKYETLFIAGVKWQMNKQDDFSIGFGEWLMKKGRYNITNWSKTTKELLEIYKNTL